MADFTLSANQAKFPVGTTVGVYGREAFPGGSLAPIGAPVTTAVVAANGTTTFTGLAVDTEYFAAAQVSGTWRRTAIRTAGLGRFGDIPETLTLGDGEAPMWDAAGERWTTGPLGSIQSTVLNVRLLAAAVTPGATSISVNRTIAPLGAHVGYIAIDPFTSECEIREVTAGTTTLTLDRPLIYSHAADDRALFFQGQKVPASWFGAKSDGVSDDEPALQQGIHETRAYNLILDGEGKDSYRLGRPLMFQRDASWEKFDRIDPLATYVPQIAESYMVMCYELGPWRTATVDAAANTVTLAGHGMNADSYVVFKGGTVPGGITEGRYYYVVNPTANTFQVSTSDGGAAIDITSAGSGFTVYGNVGSLVKAYWNRIFLYGANLPNLNGALLNIQQPSKIENVRIDTCPGTGLRLLGQHAHIPNFESIGCGTALTLDEASFMYFYSFNAEQCTRAIRIAPSGEFSAGYGGAGGAFNCLWMGLHAEMVDKVGGIVIDAHGRHRELTFINVEATLNRTDQRLYYAHTGSTPGGYLLKHVYCASGVVDARMVEDTERGQTLLSYTDFRNFAHSIEAPVGLQDTAVDAKAAVLLRAGGGRLEYGGPNLVSPTIRDRAATGQTGSHIDWQSSAGGLEARVEQGGMIRCNGLMPNVAGNNGLWSSTGTLQILAAGGTGFIAMAEQSAGPAGLANQARLFSRDNGAGKTQLCVQMPTGAVIVLATEA